MQGNYPQQGGYVCGSLCLSICQWNSGKTTGLICLKTWWKGVDLVKIDQDRCQDRFFVFEQVHELFFTFVIVAK